MHPVLGALFTPEPAAMKRFFQQLLSEISHPPKSDESAHRTEHSLKLAAAVILIETAAMDDHFDEAEREKIAGILAETFNLDPSETSELITASQKVRQRAVDVHQFTQVINESCSRDQKNRLMAAIWQVIFADGRLDAHEDYFAHKLARLIHIDHKDFITAKLNARNYSRNSRLENNSTDRPADAQAGGGSR